MIKGGNGKTAGLSETKDDRLLRSLDDAQFNVFRRSEATDRLLPMPYNRRDFYKISLVMGTSRIQYADKGIDIEKPALIFSNPLIPYAWEPLSEDQSGYYCLFTETFLSGQVRSESLQESPLFKIGSYPIFFISEAQIVSISAIFDNMLAEITSDYVYKYDLLRNYVNLLIHEALKMEPHTAYYKPQNAANRIASLFLKLLERQFPIDTPQNSLKLRTAHDFATHLSVHVNHLNRAVRDVTGKTTTAHIAERVTGEARALLTHSDWGTADIAYGLGFEYPTNFNNFFKKQTGLTPKAFRALIG